MPNSRPLYISFDVVPAPKGAAVHIEAFARALGEGVGPLDLVTVAPGVAEGRAPEPPIERWPGVFHSALPASGGDLIGRVLGFRRQLERWWAGRRAPLVHVRSIYEGYPIAANKPRTCERFVFEVNGLPSIELKYHYPDVAEDPELLRKLRRQEDLCIAAADLLVTPSAVTAAHLAARGADPARVRVIPNGVDLERFAWRAPRAWDERPVRLLYSGTLSSWQGLHVALEALALYRREFPATLTLVGPGRSRSRKELAARCESLGIAGHVTLLDPVTQDELVRLHHESDVVLAPLLANDRNLVQGACPLKVLEAMAAGTPLVASDLPVVTGLARQDEEALLVRPGSGKAIKDALLRLRADPGLAPRLSSAARLRVEREFDWRRAQAALVEAYRGLLAPSRASTLPSSFASTRD